MNPLTWQNPGQLFVAQDFIKVKIYSVAELRIYNNIPLIQDLCHAFHSNLDAKNIANTIMQEKSRLRDDNTVCYYREFPLPEKSLSQVLVLNNESKLKAENILKQKGFDNVKVKIQKLPQKDKSILLQK